MKIKAIADRIFVRLEPEAEKTSGGVLLVSDIPEPVTGCCFMFLMSWKRR